jgi:DNA replication protein DnaC
MTARREGPSDPLETIRSRLVELNLTTLARELGSLLGRVENSAPSYSQFLLQAIDIELEARTDRKLERRRRWSRLGPHVSLDNFDFSARAQHWPQAVRELATGRFVQEKRNVILVGRPSTGKTTVARAIGHAVCCRGFSVYYVSVADMLAAIHASKIDGTYRKALRRVTRPDLLILDDAGFSTLNKEKTNDLFRVVAARYREKSILAVTNLPFKQWDEFIPSPAQAVAIADRLIHDATILRFSGKSFRLPRDVYGAPLDDE